MTPSLCTFELWHSLMWLLGIQTPGSHLNMDIAAEHFRECLNVIASSPKKDEKRQVLYYPLIYFPMSEDPQQHFISDDLTLKRVLGHCGDQARKFLSSGVLPVPATSINNATPTSRRKTQLELLHDRCRVGGLICDCCGKTLEDLQMTSLKRCSRCIMVFYCSPTCNESTGRKRDTTKRAEKGDRLRLETTCNCTILGSRQSQWHWSWSLLVSKKRRIDGKSDTMG
jgi:hypothetical protein